MTLKGNRKLLFFLMLLGVAAWKLTGSELSATLITLATAFGVANGVEHFSKKHAPDDEIRR